MEISETFTVGAPPPLVWEFFKDLQAVSTCMPGTELTRETSPDTFEGLLSVKLGPIGAKFLGNASIERDEDSMQGRITAKGVDKQGGSRATATVTYLVNSNEEGGTRVDIRADIALAGQLAQFGRTGILQDISSQLTSEFVSCLQARLVPHNGPADPIAEMGSARALRPGRLLFAALWDRLKSLFRRRK